MQSKLFYFRGRQTWDLNWGGDGEREIIPIHYRRIRPLLTQSNEEFMKS